MITTLKPIRKPAMQVELSKREMEVISRFMFTAMVDVLREMNTYRETPVHDPFYTEAKAERDTIRRLQMKIDSALIDLEETQ